MSAGSFHSCAAQDDAPRSAVRAASELATKVAQLGGIKPHEIVRFESTLEPCDILAWLRRAPSGSRRYFRDRSSKLEIAGVGTAARAQFGTHDRWVQLETSTGERRAPAWFIALPFDPSRESDAAWAPFHAESGALPSIELRRDGEQHVLAVNVTATTCRATLEHDLAQLMMPVESCVVEPALVRESDGDGEAIWTRTVRAGLERIRSGALRKIVLARTRSYTASGQLDPVSVLMRLASREIRGFRFLMEAGEGKSFLGVTPERLISRSGRIARSEAVAGTRPRGVDGVADRLLGESLLASAKDRREHELVVERVREALTSCSTTLRIDAEPRLLRLAYVQHLATRVQAEMRTGVTDIDLVRLLHPTPAVAGAPVAAAIEALRALEPFDRGLYAGPVGVVSRDGAEIAVAIRSARIDGDRLTAYAGAGIVDGSDPADEWRETGHKLLAFERLAT